MTGQGTNYYETLGVGRDALPDDVRAAYRRLARTWHPDHNQDQQAAQARMAEINQAYQVLSDAARRSAYDHSLDAPLRPRPSNAVPLDPVSRAGERRSWILLLSIAFACMAVLGWVAVRTLLPRTAPMPQIVSAPHPVVHDPLPLVAAPRIEPWKEPPPSLRVVNADTEPVLRLVREGTISAPTPAPARKLP